MRNINIGLLGLGTVGSGVAKILIQNKELISSRVGSNLILKKVAVKNIDKGRDVELGKSTLTADANEIIDDPDIEIIVEMIGGETVARELILKAIENGKQVVTANKALLASQGTRLMKAAVSKGVDLAFEASVGGCMPIVKSIRESLVGNHINAMTGILNGTCNYILTKITDEGLTFEAALAKAQRKGYAEADPTLDVEGIDTSHKLAILSALAYGTEINLNDIYTEGITQITPMDIEYAKQFGYRIKLLAISKNHGDSIEARVHPAMVPRDNLLSNVKGGLNAITVSADAAGDMIHYGHGAGMMPTASAVISDLADIARNLDSESAGRVPLLSYQVDKIKKTRVMKIEDIVTHYYIRFSAMDQPGVLSKISGVLGHYGISIKIVNQKGRRTNGSVPLVMLSHTASEAAVLKALKEIAKLNAVTDKPCLIRIEDENYEE